MFFDKTASFIFSNNCLMCEKREIDIICLSCLKKLKNKQNLKIIKFQNKNLDMLIYFFKYEKIIRKLILSFKFFNKPYLAKVFSKIILKNEKICRKMNFYDIIIPVPMYKNKKKLRGYNQTELIALELAKSLKIEYNSKVLVKIKNTKMQSTLSQKERVLNVNSVFEVTNFEKVKNKNILLIDDIYTTGATLEELAKMLKKAGAQVVVGIVIAKN